MAGAVGVRAAEHFGDFVWQGESAFVDDFEVVDGVDDGFGGEEGEAVGGVVVQPDAGDFDDVFAALGFAGQVEADGYGAAVVQQFELAQDNQAFACGDVSMTVPFSMASTLSLGVSIFAPYTSSFNTSDKIAMRA